MTNNQEVWDLYDKDLNHKGTFIKGKGRIPDGYYHKTVEVIPTDMMGNIMLTRRSMFKKRGAGLLEFPAGSVLAGEKEEKAALRELLEETGLQAKELVFLQRVRTKGLIRYTYLAHIPNMTTAEINCPPEEVMGYVFVNFEQWQSLITTSEYNVSRAFYSDKLFDMINKLVNKYTSANEVRKQTQNARQPTLRRAQVLTNNPKNLDNSYFETNTCHDDELEPSFERGDDGA